MLETVRYEAERARFGTLVVSLGLAGFAAMFLLIAPGMIETIDWESFIDVYPAPLVESFGLQYLGTMAGIMAAEVYKFGWVVVLGLYLAYSMAGTVAGDVETDRMDLLLAGPVSRTRLLAEKYAAIVVPIALANGVVAAVVYGGARLVGHPLAAERVLAVHALSIPYLTCVAAIGLLLSVVVDRRVVAEAAALGGIVGMFVLDSMLRGTDAEILGVLTPMRYYDPIGVLALGEYDLTGAAILLAATVVLLLLAQQLFVRGDVE